jgi:hypothetical protein
LTSGFPIIPFFQSSILSGFLAQLRKIFAFEVD